MGLIGSRLKEMRERKGYTQEELAELIGVGQLQMWRWESNKTEPSGEYIAQLSRYLETTADYLLGLSDDAIPHFEDGDLSDMERGLVAAFRAGDIKEAIQILALQGQEDDEAHISRRKPAVNG